MQKETGKLFIVSTPIGNLEDITFRAVRILQDVDLILAEDTRKSLKLLRHYQIETLIIPFHEHNEEKKYKEIISKLKKGINIALISDAGTPLISDPGYKLVKYAKQDKLSVVPIPGPSSLIAALSASGMRSDKFTFLGFLSVKSSQRRKTLLQLKHRDESIIIFESPKRVLDTVKDIYAMIGEDVKICVARELTKIYEDIFSGSPAEIIRILEKETNKQKGEFVLIINNYQSNIDSFSYEIDRLIPILTSELKPSLAAKIASKITNLDKDICYKKIIEYDRSL